MPVNHICFYPMVDISIGNYFSKANCPITTVLGALKSKQTRKKTPALTILSHTSSYRPELISSIKTPSSLVRKSIGIVIPNSKAGYIVVGFGVFPDTCDPKLVKITNDSISSMWVVEVFSEKFGEVCLPERLVHTAFLKVAKVNESLGLLEYHYEGDMRVCGVWSREDGANKTFSKIYTVKVEGKSLYRRVLWFRNNGEVIMERYDDNYEESRIEVYEPFYGHINGVGINGKTCMFSAWSYIETLLLLDASDSIIR
ncbi:hypothetical protein Tco_0567773 [Tanacetum coccineum]